MRRVLLIDDTKAVRSALQAALDPLGMEIEHAESGPTGLQKILGSQWDLVFLDIEMPLMDGPTLLRIARARGVTTPVVLVTGVSSTPVLSAAIRLGAAHFIPKPFTAAQIRAAATKLLKLEPSKLDAAAPRVLVLSPDSALADDLARRLPAHVVVATSSALNQLVDQIGEHPPGIVLLDERAARGGVEIAAAAVRVFAASAGIFVVRDGEVPEASFWSPQAALDGVVPRAASELVVHELFYANFLRPLVFLDDTTVRPAGFQGDPRFLPAYFASITRHLIARCAPLGAIEGLRVDLTLAPPEPAYLVPLIATVNTTLTARGAPPWFTVSPSVAPTLTHHPELTRAMFL